MIVGSCLGDLPVRCRLALTALLVSAFSMSAADAASSTWVRSWGAAPQAPSAAVGPFPATPTFHNQTVRQVVRLSGGGDQVRIRLTNEYGDAPLQIGAARIAVAGESGAVLPEGRVLTFGGKPAAVIRPGAPLISDPIPMAVKPLSRLAISLYLPGDVVSCTCHDAGLETAYIVPGDQTAAASLSDAATTQRRVLLAAVDVVAPVTAKTIVILGDSISDGVGSTADADRRWPDLLAERLLKQRGSVAYVANEAISGNRILNGGMGIGALARFDRDVLATPGLAYVVVFEGINDIGIAHAPPIAGPMGDALKRLPGGPTSADDIIDAYKQMIDRAHAHGVKIYGATIAPYEGALYASPEGEAQRQAVNAWIRTRHAFDAVLDFDAVLRDPAHPARIREGLHAGDHLHGSDAGYKALANSIDLSLFR